MRNIGLIGKARAGKDTAAAHLVAARAYTRLAFADPLKEAALRVDPLIPMNHLETHARLSDCVATAGWEGAKDKWPEVRRVLQQMGQTVREIDEDFWLRELLRKAVAAAEWNMPVVVTDVRYRNEAESLRRAGFKLVRITRPAPMLTAGQPITARHLSDATAAHASETELDGFAADHVIDNGGSLDALHAMIAAAAER